MDNRTDQTEDTQSTPEHPAGRVPGLGSEPLQLGLTGGPHNDVPRSRGVKDTFQPWQERRGANDSATDDASGSAVSSSPEKVVTHTERDAPLPWLISAAGLLLLLLAVQRVRRR